jgi:hypothetical protein
VIVKRYRTIVADPPSGLRDLLSGPMTDDEKRGVYEYIEALEAENERLRGALTEITTAGCVDCMKAARAGVHPICGPRESAVCEAWIAHRALASYNLVNQTTPD